MTWLGSSEPDAHAEPVEMQIPMSLSRYSTEAEVDYVLEKLPPIIKGLRDLSPFGPDKDVSTFQ